MDETRLKQFLKKVISPSRKRKERSATSSCKKDSITTTCGNITIQKLEIKSNIAITSTHDMHKNKPIKTQTLHPFSVFPPTIDTTSSTSSESKRAKIIAASPTYYPKTSRHTSVSASEKENITKNSPKLELSNSTGKECIMKRKSMSEISFEKSHKSTLKTQNELAMQSISTGNRDITCNELQYKMYTVFKQRFHYTLPWKKLPPKKVLLKESIITPHELKMLIEEGRDYVYCLAKNTSELKLRQQTRGIEWFLTPNEVLEFLNKNQHDNQNMIELNNTKSISDSTITTNKKFKESNDINDSQPVVQELIKQPQVSNSTTIPKFPIKLPPLTIEASATNITSTTHYDPIVTNDNPIAQKKITHNRKSQVTSNTQTNDECNIISKTTKDTVVINTTKSIYMDSNVYQSSISKLSASSTYCSHHTDTETSTESKNHPVSDFQVKTNPSENLEYEDTQNYKSKTDLCTKFNAEKETADIIIACSSSFSDYVADTTNKCDKNNSSIISHTIDEESYGIDTHTSCSTADYNQNATCSKSSVDASLILLKDWLPCVLHGFDSILINKFVVAFLNDVGVVTVEDFIEGYRRQQFTAKFLDEYVGLKIGHFNRIEKAIQLNFLKQKSDVTNVAVTN